MSMATQIIRFGLMSGRHLDDQVGDQIGGSGASHCQAPLRYVPARAFMVGRW
jgi:hypothetical protein